MKTLLCLTMLASTAGADVVRLPGALVVGERPRPMPIRVSKPEPGPISASVTDGTATAVYEFVDATLAVGIDGVGGFTQIRRGSAPSHTKGWEASR